MKAEDFGYVKKGKILLFQKGPLSQWYGGYKGQEASFSPKGGPFNDEGEIVFNTCEKWMMASKAVIMGDEETLELILAENNPKKQKELGRKIKNFDPVKWDKHKKNVVYLGNYWKFTQNPHLYDFLMSFSLHTKFAEASPWDKIWGIGLGPNDERAWNTKTWQGENLLGKAINKVRKDLEHGK